MFSSDLKGNLIRAAAGLDLCRGCLGPLNQESEAGLCGRCWEGLLPLPMPRCPRCALVHGEDRDCPEPVAWDRGDALWDYHGGRPALGALLVPGIKEGEMGWKAALLRRMESVSLPAFVADADLVTCAPTALFRRWIRGFDLAEEAARHVANRIGKPFLRTLSKDWRRSRQAGLTESERRILPRRAFRIRRTTSLAAKRILLVDDVWTTGTTLLRCAQALREAGVADVKVLAMFRAT